MGKSLQGACRRRAQRATHTRALHAAIERLAAEQSVDETGVEGIAGTRRIECIDERCRDETRTRGVGDQRTPRTEFEDYCPQRLRMGPCQVHCRIVVVDEQGGFVSVGQEEIDLAKKRYKELVQSLRRS